MNLQQAQEILKPQEDGLEGLKAAYRRACKLYHPDVNPDGLEMMKLVNAAYELMKAKIGLWSTDEFESHGPSMTERMQELFNKIRHWPDIEAEIIGDWMWIWGDSMKYSIRLFGMGFQYSKKRGGWYWYPPDFEFTPKDAQNPDMTLREMRNYFGSQKLEQEPWKKL